MTPKKNAYMFFAVKVSTFSDMGLIACPRLWKYVLIFKFKKNWFLSLTLDFSLSDILRVPRWEKKCDMIKCHHHWYLIITRLIYYYVTAYYFFYFFFEVVFNFHFVWGCLHFNFCRSSSFLFFIFFYVVFIFDLLLMSSSFFYFF